MSLEYDFSQTLMEVGLSSLFRPTPIETIDLGVLTGGSISIPIFMKREDLRHPYLSGNKWHKLKYCVSLSLLMGKRPLLSFGGAFSNHIHALAAAGSYFSIPTLALIRDSAVDSATLSDAKVWGMELLKLSRSAYRQRAKLMKSRSNHEWREILGSSNWERFETLFPGGWGHSAPPLVIPEGGGGRLGVLGVASLAREVVNQCRTGNISWRSLNHWLVACGTGSTLAGLVAGLHWLGLTDTITVTGISVLKGERFLERDVARYLADLGVPDRGYKILHDFHHGGYGRITPELVAFKKNMESVHWPVDLDFVYTLKLIDAVCRLQKERYWSGTDGLLVFHTGGLQGNRSYSLTGDHKSV